MKYLNNTKLDSLRIFSLRVLVISGPYIRAASRVEIRRESRGVLPAMVSRAPRFIFQWNDLAQIHRLEDLEAKKK